jgi:hypothetical protein
MTGNGEGQPVSKPLTNGSFGSWLCNNSLAKALTGRAAGLALGGHFCEFGRRSA